jgi:membrane protease YdiL (CAAX protease family)
MKKLTNTITSTETALGLGYIALQVFILPFVLVQGNLLLGNPFSAAQLNFMLFCVDFLCVTVIFHRFLLQGAKRALATPFTCLRYAFLGFLLHFLGSFLINTVIMSVYPDFSNVNDATISGLTQQNYQLMSLGTVLLVPITEEVLYRGVVFGKLHACNPFVAYVVSTLVFAALHVVGYIGYYKPLHLLLCFLQYIPAGLCLAWAYVKADSIWAPILMHMTVNQIGMLAMR